MACVKYDKTSEGLALLTPSTAWRLNRFFCQINEFSLGSHQQFLKIIRFCPSFAVILVLS
jgi:hypothetical protein